MKTIEDVIKSLKNSPANWDASRILLQSRCHNIIIHSSSNVGFKRSLGGSYWDWRMEKPSIMQRMKLWWLLNKIK